MTDRVKAFFLQIDMLREVTALSPISVLYCIQFLLKVSLALANTSADSKDTESAPTPPSSTRSKTPTPPPQNAHLALNIALNWELRVEQI